MRSDLFRLVARRLWIVVFASLLTTGAAVGISSVMTPVYEASATLIADKNPPVVLANSGPDSNFFAQQVAQAPDVLTLTELVKSDVVREAAVARLAPGFEPSAFMAALSRALRVQQVRNTDLVRLTVRDRSPDIAAAVANAVAQSVVDMDLGARRRFVSNAREFIGSQLEAAGRDLSASELVLRSFKDRYHDVALSQETQLNLQKLASLEERLMDVRLQEQNGSGARDRSVDASRQPSSHTGVDPVIAGLQTQLASLQIEATGLRMQFTPKHPLVLSAEAKIEEAKRKLNSEIARQRGALNAQAQELSAEAGRVEQRLLQVPTREAELARLTRSAREAERNYLLLSEKFQQARVAEGSIGSAVRIVDAAKVPSAPVVPRRRTNTILGAVLGLMLGGAAVYVLEETDETVRTARDVEQQLGAPVLGTIPFLPTRRFLFRLRRNRIPPLLTQCGPRSTATEAFRALRTHVIRAMRGAESTCLLVTSALPQEGKSTVAANFALTLANTERSVWLIDCDLRHPVVDRLFPDGKSAGLSALLSGRVTAEDIVRPIASQARLHCVVSGPAVLDPPALLETQDMHRFMKRASDRADVIVLDSPALLPVTDAEVMGLQADGALLVVRLGKTDRRALGRARQRIESLGIRLVGAVLNNY